MYKFFYEMPITKLFVYNLKNIYPIFKLKLQQPCLDQWDKCSYYNNKLKTSSNF